MFVVAVALLTVTLVTPAVPEVLSESPVGFWLLGALAFGGAFLAIRFPLLNVGSGGVSV